MLALISDLAAKDVSTILVTHRLQDLFEVTDRLAVMYEGTMRAVLDTRATSLDELVLHIVGERGQAAA